jgi:hypothetical protein
MKAVCFELGIKSAVMVTFIDAYLILTACIQAGMNFPAFHVSIGKAHFRLVFAYTQKSILVA